MPRTPRPWFRFYSEAIDNAKLQRLDGEHFKLYVNLLCIANQATPRGQLPRAADIAFRLRIDLDPLIDRLQELRRRNLLDGPGRSYRIHDWQDWQPDSDANQTPGRKDRNAERTRKERATDDERTHRVEVEESKSKEVEKRGEVEVNAQARETDLPPSFLGLKSEIENTFGLGFITLGDTAKLQEYCRKLPRTWIEAAISQTKKAPRPSWSYLLNILVSCDESGQPPSSIKPQASPKLKSLRYQEAAV